MKLDLLDEFQPETRLWSTPHPDGPRDATARGHRDSAARI